MPKRPSFFYQGECGCYGQDGNAIPVVQCTGALISDNRYFALTTATHGQVIVVPKGSNAQTFLSSAFNGFVLFADGEIVVSKTPALTLPIQNPAVSGSFPLPGGFQYLMIGTGEPANWKMVAAPTVGTWILQALNGSFQLVDGGLIPGIQLIGESGTFASKAPVVGLVNTGTDEIPVWTLRRVTVLHKHVLVGDIDEDTGVVGYTALPSASPLEHPKAKIPEMKFFKLITIDSDGDDITGGLEQATVTGTGSISDPTRICYSPTTNRLYRSPAHTIVQTQVSTDATATPPTGSYINMPSGHGAGTVEQFNYPTVRIDFAISMTGTLAAYLFGIHRDGVLIKAFTTDAANDITLPYIDTNCPLGTHTYDVRWSKSSGSAEAVIKNSALVVSTMG